MATYWVATDGDDEAVGSYAAPVKTINKGIDLASNAGDILYVRSGTYNERVTIDNSGSAVGGYITITGYWDDATKPICRGFDLNAKSYVRIIGFEIFHVSIDYSRGIVLANTCDHVHILDNYVHETYNSGGMIRWYNSACTYVVIRGNHLYYGSHPTVVEGYALGTGLGVQCHGGDHNLIEYNILHRVGDFANVFGQYDIVRNNYMYDFLDDYWEDAESTPHCDFFQPAGMAPYPSQHQIYESNVLLDNNESNSHVLQMQTEDDSDDHDILFRGNVAARCGSYFTECRGVDKTRFYNNTFHSLNELNAAANAARYNGTTPEDTSDDNVNRNNLFSSCGSGAIITVDVGEGDVTADHNWAYNSGNHASVVGSADPKFVNAASDWSLQSDSPVIDQGAAITLVNNANGSGTEFAVDDAGFFCDGYDGIVEGDLIAVGTGDPVRITAISGNTITVASSISWSDNDPVYWRSKAALDIGAYEYRATYAYTVALNVASDGTITATPTVPALVRDVELWIDGLPVARDYDSPYTHSWNLAGLSGQHLVEVRAHALYADPDLWQEADRTVTVTDGVVTGGTGALYEFVYDGNGALTGTVPTEDDQAESASVTIKTNSGSLARESYYALVKWNTAADGSGTDYVPGATMTMPAYNVTLYAVWQLKGALIAG